MYFRGVWGNFKSLSPTHSQSLRDQLEVTLSLHEPQAASTTWHSLDSLTPMDCPPKTRDRKGDGDHTWSRT